MAMDKELALAFNFVDAPDSVKRSAEAHQASWLRFQKATAQVDKWQKELHQAEIAYGASGKEFRKEIAQWDPADTRSPQLDELDAVVPRR